jgi:hypothetical protein
MIYYGPEKLEKLLEDLFADDEELGLEDTVVLRRPILFSSSPNCCTYNYTSYGG